MIIFVVISAIGSQTEQTLRPAQSEQSSQDSSRYWSWSVCYCLAHLLMMIIFVVISAIVAKLNRLLDQLNVRSRLKTVADIGAGVFVTA